jgi:hypothetical protein
MALPETIPFSSFYTLVALDERILSWPNRYGSTKFQMPNSKKGKPSFDH